MDVEGDRERDGDGEGCRRLLEARRAGRECVLVGPIDAGEGRGEEVADEGSRGSCGGGGGGDNGDDDDDDESEDAEAVALNSGPC